MYILVPWKHLGKKVPQICSLKKLSSSVVSGKPNSDIDCNVQTYLLPSLLISENNVHFSAQETPGEKVPTDLQLKKLSSSVVSGKPNSDFNFLHYK